MSAAPMVWVFNGTRGRFPGAVFRDREAAEKWIGERGRAIASRALQERMMPIAIPTR